MRKRIFSLSNKKNAVYDETPEPEKVEQLQLLVNNKA